MMLDKKRAPVSVMLAAVLAVAAPFAGCGSDPSGDAPVETDAGHAKAQSDAGILATDNDSGGRPMEDAAARVDGAKPADAATPSGFGTVFTIVMENHDYKEIVGSSDAPFFNSLIASYGLATNYNDSGTHPSLPNYLMMISGATQYIGVIDVEPTNALVGFPKDVPNLGTQLQAAQLPWRSYSEDMGSPCTLASAGDYATKHVPFLYFTDIQTGTPGLCAKANVDYGGLASDLALGTYKYMWITPNLIHDGHDPVNLLGSASDPVAALKASDAWAQTEITKIMASPAYTNGGVIFLTWDEGAGRNGNSKDQVPMIIISPKIVSPGFKSAKAYTHKSYLATVEDILKLPRLATVANEASMMEFFK